MSEDLTLQFMTWERGKKSSLSQAAQQGCTAPHKENAGPACGSWGHQQVSFPGNHAQISLMTSNVFIVLKHFKPKYLF